MHYLFYSLVVLLMFVLPAHAEEKKSELKLETFDQKLSYAMGLDLGAYFKNMGENLDLQLLQQGIGDAFTGEKPRMSTEELAEVQQQFATIQKERRAKQASEMIEKNKKKADEFLAENQKKEGVKTTASGLQYKVITEGSGDKPTAKDTVKVHYRGTLLDGTEFDSSYKRDKPTEFRLDQVIPGWTEALQLMGVGSKYQLFLPAALAYGDRGIAPDIEPGSMLIFEVELLEIEKEKK